MLGFAPISALPLSSIPTILAVALAGVGATGSPGTLEPSTGIALAGVDGAGQVGDLTASGAAPEDLTAAKYQRHKYPNLVLKPPRREHEPETPEPAEVVEPASNEPKPVEAEPIEAVSVIVDLVADEPVELIGEPQVIESVTRRVLEVLAAKAQETHDAALQARRAQRIVEDAAFDEHIAHLIVKEEAQDAQRRRRAAAITLLLLD